MHAPAPGQAANLPAVVEAVVQGDASAQKLLDAWLAATVFCRRPMRRSSRWREAGPVHGHSGASQHGAATRGRRCPGTPQPRHRISLPILVEALRSWRRALRLTTSGSLANHKRGGRVLRGASRSTRLPGRPVSPRIRQAAAFSHREGLRYLLSYVMALATSQEPNRVTHVEPLPEGLGECDPKLSVG